jgi:hypothetical protein
MVKCVRCGRPLDDRRAWWKYGKPYCDEHVIINTITHTWRVIGRHEPEPSPIERKLEIPRNS